MRPGAASIESRSTSLRRRALRRSLPTPQSRLGIATIGKIERVIWYSLMRTISATEFKAKCLAILDEVERTGEGVTILKRGRPVAQIVPTAGFHDEAFPQHSLRGTVTILGDIVAPVLPADAWESDETRS
jgi:prevent-host-death family protein